MRPYAVALATWLLLVVVTVAWSQFSMPATVPESYDGASLNIALQDVWDKCGTKFSAKKAGLVPVGLNDTTKFLNSAGAWAVPPGTYAVPTSARYFYRVNPPDEVGDWIGDTATTDTAVDLSDDGVAAGASAVVLRVWLNLSAGTGGTLYIGPAGRATADYGDAVGFLNSGNTLLADTYIVSLQITSLSLNARWSVDPGTFYSGQNKCYVVGYFK